MVSSPPRLALTYEQRCCSSIDDHILCSDFGPRAHYPEQGDMDPAQ